MFTENGVVIDLGEVKKAVQQADVFAIGFRLFAERLLVDTRHDEKTPPLVQVVEPVDSVEQRFFWLGQHRPSLGTPERFIFFLWPHSIAFLEQCGVVARIRCRCEATERPEALSMFDRALTDLREKERRATRAAITGGSPCRRQTTHEKA